VIASTASPTVPAAPARLVRGAFEVARLATAAVLVVLVGALLAGTVPSLVGYESFVVLSGSMEPNLHVGDLAVVGPVRQDQLEVGDVISYRTPQRPDVVVTHRLIGIGEDERGRPALQTKGDANDSADQVMVEPGAVLGRVAYGVPMIGYLVEFARRPEGKLLLLACPAFLLALDAFMAARKRQSAPVQPEPLTVTSSSVSGIGADAAELVSRGRIALENGGPGIARLMFDRAIAADPFCEDAWLLKAICLKDPVERLACLQAGLTVNPMSIQLKDAVANAVALDRAS
jgi:signal peptidase I